MKLVWIVLLNLSLIMPALAAENANNEENQTQINSDELEQLITTLENDTAREAFVRNLKTLLEYQKQEDEPDRSVIDEWLNLDETSESLVRSYVDQLNQLGYTDSVIGGTATLIITLIVVLLLLWGNKKLAAYFDRKLSSVRQKLGLADHRFSGYFTLQRWFGYLLALLLLSFAGVEAYSLFMQEPNLGFSITDVLVYLVSLFFTALLFVSIWEWVNFFVEYGAHRTRRISQTRIQTLMPIVRNFLMFSLTVLGIMVILSELGVDIMPLLAGAGVVGIAIGFGAQTLVKDFITGFIIIFEDLLQVGDVIRAGDRVGVVETISIRRIQLRALDGTVYTIPYSQVDVLDNLTKNYSYYLMDIGVAYRENTDEVIQCLKAVDEELREAEDYKDKILEPLEILGVDKFADSAVVIKARIKTVAHDRWFVGREFNRRMKIAFDEQNIEIPFPHQTIYFGADKSGEAPSANVRLFESGNDENDNNENENADSEKSKTRNTERQSSKSQNSEDQGSDGES